MPDSRAAIIGTGMILGAHVGALRSLGIPIAGILGSSPRRAQTKAKTLQIERVYATYDEVLSDPDVTVVHICTPNQYHYLMARQALEAGKHVVCEKPLAMSTAEADELVSLAATTGLVGAICFINRFYPLVREMRARVRRGDLGNLFIVQGVYLQDWLLEETDWNWRLEPAAGGTLRVVGDIGSHWLDLATYITGQRVSEVFADLATFLPTRRKPLSPVATFEAPASGGEYEVTPITTEDYAALLLRFDGGTHGVVALSQLNSGRKNRLTIEVSGSKAAMAWNCEQPEELWVGRRHKPNETVVKDPEVMSDEARRLPDFPAGHIEGFPDTFRHMFRAVYAAIGGDPSTEYPTFSDGAEQMRIAEAVAESARLGKWVGVPRQA